MSRVPTVERLLQAFLRSYARGQAAAVAPFLVGRRLLDLGAGEGYVGRWLAARAGVRVCSVDVGAFGRTRGVYVVYDGLRLPFGDAVFDTTLLLLMLHHCEKPEAVLDEALRVTRRRLIVVESVYRTALERAWLLALDGRLNRRRHGGAMPLPLGFRRPEEWRALFESRGLAVVATRWLGAWWERLVHHPMLFVVAKDAAAGGAQGPRGWVGRAAPGLEAEGRA
jgi:SAM-dependent methyltransferase